MTLTKKDAINAWTTHLKKSKKNSEGQMKRHYVKYLTAAKKIREGLAPKDIQRETGIVPGTTKKVQKMIEKGEI